MRRLKDEIERLLSLKVNSGRRVPIWRAGVWKWTSSVSHVGTGSRDDHGKPIAGGDDQKCRKRVGSRSTGIQDTTLHSWNNWH